ncbi:cytochrome P450, partial [Rhizophagus diaphanus]
SNLFCFIIYHLIHHPEVVQRLRQEFDEVLGKDVTKPITQNDIDKLQYCDAVIKEVHRHFPVNYSLGRVNIEKDTVGGYIWPEKTSFSILYCAIMKRKDYWTDPEKFDPDRFYKIDDDDKYLLEKQHVKNAFAMFGGGIRACPGRKLTMIELKCLLTLIYRKYDIELADPNAPLNYSSTLLSVCKELLVKVKPRNF